MSKLATEQSFDRVERAAARRRAGCAPAVGVASRRDGRHVAGRAMGPSVTPIDGRVRLAGCDGPSSAPAVTGGQVDALADLVASAPRRATTAQVLAFRRPAIDLEPEVSAPQVAAVRTEPAPVASPVSSTSPSTVSSTMRLTRRGRFVVGLVATLAVTAMLAWWAWPASAVSSSGAVTVTSGDTLWSIAQDVPSDESTGDVVADIAELNGLSSTGELPVGERLLLPAY